MPKIHLRVFWTNGTYEKEILIDDEAINYKRIEIEVATFLQQLQIKERSKIYEKMPHEEKQLETSKQFKHDVDISCRFSNDYFLLMDRMKLLYANIGACIQELSLKSDPLNLNRLPSLTSKKISSIIPKKSLDIAVLISNPLVRRTSEDFKSTQKPLVNIKSEKQRFKEILKKKNPELHSKIAVANENNIRDCASCQAKVLILICDVLWDSDRQKVLLLLEDADLRHDKECATGLEKPYSVSEIVSLLTYKPKLIILAGWCANLAGQQIQRCELNVITINTKIYGRDTMAQKFISNYIEHICQGESIKNSYLDAINSFKSSFIENDRKIIDANLCCCLHEHAEGCKYLQLEEKYGGYLVHEEFHRFCLDNSQLGCKIQAIYRQIKDFQEFESADCRQFCCCGMSNISENHALDKKFNTFFRNDSDLPLFHPTMSVQKVEPCVQAPRKICNVTQTQLNPDELPHRNKDIWWLIQLLHHQQQRINIFSSATPTKDDHDCEKAMLVKNAIAYLLERNQPIEYVELWLRSDTNSNDLKRKIGEKLHHQYRFALSNQDLIKKMEGRRLVVCVTLSRELQRDRSSILANLMDQINKFSNELKGKIKKTLIFLSEQQLPSELRQGEKEWLLRSLEAEEALDICLNTINKKRNQSKPSIFDINKQKLDDMLRAFIDLKNSGRTLNERVIHQITSANTIKNFSDALRILKPTETQQHRVILVKPSEELREMLLFLSQFEEGISFSSLLRMSNMKLIPNDWDKMLKCRVQEEEKMIENLKKEEEAKSKKVIEILKHTKNQQKHQIIDLVPANHYYNGLQPGKFQLFDIISIEKEPNAIRVHRRRLGPVGQEEAKRHQIKKLKYLAVESVNFMAGLRSKEEYKSQLFDYNAMSLIGFFYYKTAGQREVEKQLDPHYETVDVQKNVIKQKEYFNSIFKIKAQLIENDNQVVGPKTIDYYCTAVLNFTTLMRLLIGRVAWELIEGSIEQAIKSTSELSNNKVSRNLLLIKLEVMKISIKIYRKEYQTLEQALGNFSNRIKTLINEIPDQTLRTWLNKVNRIEYPTMNLLTKLGRKGEINNKEFFLSAKKIFQRLEKIQDLNTRGLKTRFVIFFAQCTRQAENDEIQKCRKLKQLQDDLIEATSYLTGDLKQIKEEAERVKYQNSVLAIHSKLLRIDVKMRQSQETEEELLSTKSRIDSIAQLIKNPATIMSNQRRTEDEQLPSDSFKHAELTKYYESLMIRNNKKIINLFKDVLVFMRAQPIWTGGDTTVRKPNSFRKRIENTLKQTKVITIFSTLTKEALLNVLMKACLIMVLTLDVQVQKIQGTDKTKQQLTLLLEHDKLPTAERVDYKSIEKELTHANFEVLILCGRNTCSLMTKIKQGRKGNPSTIYALDTMQRFENAGQDYFARECKLKFTEDVLMKYFSDMANGKNKSSTLETGHTLYYYFDNLEKSRFKEVPKNWTPRYFTQKKEQRCIQFSKGDYTDASSQLFSPHNFITTNNYAPTVGREREIYELVKFIVDISERQKGTKGKYLNLIGPSGIGKKTTMTEVAWQLILKGHFLDGIYQINCNQNNIEPRSLMDYIENHIPTLYKTLTNLQNQNPNLLIIFFNVDRLEDFYSDKFFREVQEKNITVVFTSIHKIQQPICLNYELKALTEKEIEMFVYSFVDIKKFVQQKVPVQNILKEFRKEERADYQIPEKLKLRILELSGHLGYIKADRIDMEMRDSIVLDRSIMGRSDIMSALEYPEMTASSRHAIFTSQTGVIETSSTKPKQYIKLKLN